MIPDPSTTDPTDLAKWIISTGFPLEADPTDEDAEKNFVLDIAHNSRYIYWGENLNAEKLHRLRVIYHMCVGWLRP